MGGNAFNESKGIRIPRDEAIIVSSELKKSIEDSLVDSSIVESHFPIDKKDYGDIDIFLINNNEKNWVRKISRAIEAEKYIQSGKNATFLCKGIQIDIKTIPENSKDFAFMSSMHSFLGGFLSYTGINYDSKISYWGVYNNKKFEGLNSYIKEIITQNPIVLLEAMDISRNILDRNIKSKDVIDIISSSDQIGCKESMIQKFYKSIEQGNHSYSTNLIEKAIRASNTTKSLEERKEYFFHIMKNNNYDPEIVKYKAMKEIDSKKKFNGNIAYKWSGLKNKDLGEAIKKFQSLFVSKENFIDYIIDNSEEKIKKDFKKIARKHEMSYK